MLPAALGSAQAASTAERVAEAREHFERGRDAYRDGRLKQALEHLVRAYELAPSAELEYDLARVYERIGEASGAIRHYERYLASAKVSDEERAQIARKLEAQRALIARQRDQIKAAPPSPGALTAEARAFFQRGLKLFARKQYRAAHAAFEAARRFAKLPELAYNLALTCERLARTAEAVDHYRTYLREAEGAPDAERVQARVQELLLELSQPR